MNWGSTAVAVVMETIDVDCVDSFLFLFRQQLFHPKQIETENITGLFAELRQIFPENFFLSIAFPSLFLGQERKK
jgi:hypothetical protein